MKRKKRKIIDTYWLIDNSIQLTLTQAQRDALDAKCHILYPPIQLIENARHGINRRRALFLFENTINIEHWAERAKANLLGTHTGHYHRTIKKLSTKTILYEQTEAERQEIERQARETAKRMDEQADSLKNLESLINRGAEELFELSKKCKNMSDKELLRAFNQANMKTSKFDGISHRPIVGVKNVPNIREYLKKYRELCSVDTPEKADAWVMAIIEFTGDFQFVLDYLDTKEIISVTDDERTQIMHRYESEGKPDIFQFSPYAATAIKLFMTMYLFLIENKLNSTSREVLRDYEYLYYALDDNVNFVSADKGHRRFIEEIPTLELVRNRFTYVDRKDPQAIEKWLKSIGIDM